MLGNGKLSLEHALFKSVKSIQTFHISFFFFTRTGLESVLVKSLSNEAGLEELVNLIV